MKDAQGLAVHAHAHAHLGVTYIMGRDIQQGIACMICLKGFLCSNDCLFDCDLAPQYNRNDSGLLLVRDSM